MTTRSNQAKKSQNASSLVAAMGSVMEIWPEGDYSEHLPAYPPAVELNHHWQSVARYLNQAEKSLTNQKIETVETKANRKNDR